MNPTIGSAATEAPSTFFAGAFQTLEGVPLTLHGSGLTLKSCCCGDLDQPATKKGTRLSPFAPRLYCDLPDLRDLGGRMDPPGVTFGGPVRALTMNTFGLAPRRARGPCILLHRVRLDPHSHPKDVRFSWFLRCFPDRVCI